jgi:hypothetical protein
LKIPFEKALGKKESQSQAAKRNWANQKECEFRVLHAAMRRVQDAATLTRYNLHFVK